VLEARDTEIAISFWKQKAEAFGSPPPIGEFDLVDLDGQSFRFLILDDLLSQRDSVFLAYGGGFAKLFGLPERPPMRLPMIDCVPYRYRYLFLEACGEAIAEAAPVRFSGEVAGLGGSERYRACFMPLRMRVDTMRGIYGSFNFRFLTAAELRERSAQGYSANTTPPGLPTQHIRPE
jgi:hypothetical protein